jgi:hypothetical protein
VVALFAASYSLALGRATPHHITVRLIGHQVAYPLVTSGVTAPREKKLLAIFAAGTNCKWVTVSSGIAWARQSGIPEAAPAEPFEELARAVQFHCGADPCGKASGDRGFGGYVVALLANQALYLGLYRQVIQDAETAPQGTREHLTPALVTDLSTLQAKAYARMETGPAAMRACALLG